MAPAPLRKRNPSIVLPRSDYEALERLAESVSSKNPAIANDLFAELDRARIVVDSKFPRQVVRMGSSLRFTTDAGEDRSVTLVFPGKADIAEGRVSVLTPIGIALLGLAAGQSINWTARNGRVHRLTVESVDHAPAMSEAAGRLGRHDW